MYLYLYLMLSMALKILCSSISSPLLSLPLSSSFRIPYFTFFHFPSSLPPFPSLHPSFSLPPSLPELSQERGLTCDDIISTLQYYSLLKYWKGKHIIIRRKVRLLEHGKVFFYKTIQWNPSITHTNGNQYFVPNSGASGIHVFPVGMVCVVTLFTTTWLHF